MGLAASRGESVSALVETLLREHSLVREEILLARMEEKLPDILAVPGRNSRLRKALKVASKRPSP